MNASAAPWPSSASARWQKTDLSCHAGGHESPRRANFQIPTAADDDVPDVQPGRSVPSEAQRTLNHQPSDLNVAVDIVDHIVPGSHDNRLTARRQPASAPDSSVGPSPTANR